MALYAMPTPREHIEEIRKEKFLIGSEKVHRILEEFHGTVELLSDELYAKDVHFFMELIQNAEDNEYQEGVDPSLEFVITSRDITGTGAPATLLMFNNEIGFSAKNIESICSFAKSTKKGNRKRGYIGEKGIGFKSVFLVTSRPYIFSNGYQIRFNEEPCPDCGLGYAVPEWVEENPSLSDIQKVYGSSSTLPATILILPLKREKIHAVKQELSRIHPEVLLFLSKIKRLSVREDNEDPRLNTVSAIAISTETECKTRKNIDAESYTLELSANGDQFDKECRYHMWRQKFPVKQENKSKRRMDIEEWVITLAFPNGERVQRGTSSPGVYAFLPTEMVTNLPFIIQADFLLSSSRETIRLDDKWNQGILNCVPSAFVDALVTLVTMTDAQAPVSSSLWMFCFLPVNSSPYPELNAVRESIRAKLVEKDIVPSESGMDQNFFYKPCEVGRLMPPFWNILERVKEENVSLKNLSHHGMKVLNSSFDKEEYDLVLNFLGVGHVNSEWYSKCIQSLNLVLRVSEDVYLELLLFLAENWSFKFRNSNIGDVPLIKYVDLDGNVALCSINASAKSQRRVCLAHQQSWQSWLIDWNRKFRCPANHFFMPMSTYDAVQSSSKTNVVLEWLKDQVKVVIVTVNDYAAVLIDHLNHDRKLSVAYAHFLYHSFSKKYLSSGKVDLLCGQMPLVDNYGDVKTRRSGVLVPANESKWAELIVSNPWSQEGYVELGEDYLSHGNFAGRSTPRKQFMDFLKTHLKASDIPDISPPNAGIPAVSGPLTKQNTFLLLDWIKNLKYKGIRIPQKFLTCIKDGNWLTITTNGYSGYRPPSESFFPHSSWADILQNGSVIVDIPLVNESFYGEGINKYKEELKTVGVMFEFAEACEFIGKHLMSLSLAASSNVTRDNVFSILNFIKFLRGKSLPPDSFIQSIKDGSWLKTSQGYKSPGRTVLNNQAWKNASQISDLPFIDQNYYGQEIISFKVELQLLGVVVGFNKNYQLVIDNLKSPSCLNSLSADAVRLILACIRRSGSSDKLVRALGNTKCLKTNAGFKSPGECFLCDPQWGCLLEVFGCFPIIDETFYGSNIVYLKRELQQLGVVVDFEKAVEAFVRHFKQQASSFSISKDHVLLFLSCYRQLKGMSLKFPAELKSCIREVKWLRTRLSDYRSPRDCILFGPDWESISPITLLPFIDDSDHFYGNAIHEYKSELKSMGTAVAFTDGVKFVADGLHIPLDPSNVTPANVLSLLKCIRMLQKKNFSLSESFAKQVSQKWLKTHIGDGYSSPNQCLLFDKNWESYLKQTDGPFIDEEFYGSEIKSFRRELIAIGVTVDVEKCCALLACHLDYHTCFATIVRIYKYLAMLRWEADVQAAARIWIPDGSRGQWVSPEECVLHDKDRLFSSLLNVLDQHYEPELLNFFSSAFRVKSNPLIDDYYKLWKVWESSGHKLSNAKCCAFWLGAVEQCSSRKAEELAESLVKLPVNSGSDEVMLLDKRDVFIADDLQLKDVIEKSSRHSLFVWYPQPSLLDLPRTMLLELYRKIGVRTISDSVQKEELSLGDGVGLKQLNQKDYCVGKGLVKLILGFLADPSFQLEAAKRHEAVNCLLNLTILETAEPITLRYSLSLSSGEIIDVRACQMIRWDRKSGKLFVQKIDRSGGGQKNLVEYAIQFAETISKGVLWDREDHINSLSELIKFAFLVEFNEEAVEILMKSKNMQIFIEDQEFLSAAFPPGE
ncbi:hypothetical protein WN943_019391 [Citrus x changshan-huyou]|nr:uncharacterized protein LOC102612796 isoform X1 [Citrus sinensis]